MATEVPLAGPDALKTNMIEGFAAVAEAYDIDGREYFGPAGRALVQEVEVPTGARLLDVGCGKGAVSLPAAEAVSPRGHVTGIDLAVPMLEQAIQRARVAGLANVNFIRGDAEDPGICPGWPPASFDVVLAGNVLQFLPRPTRAVLSWRRMLTPGGTVGISWTVGEEPRWVSVIAAVDAHVPDGVPAFGAFIRRPPFDAVGEMDRLLTRAGLVNVATVTWPVTMAYNGPEQWWTIVRTQDPWALSWRHIRPDRIAQARCDANVLLESMREADGMIVRTLTFAFTIGRKAAS